MRAKLSIFLLILFWNRAASAFCVDETIALVRKLERTQEVVDFARFQKRRTKIDDPAVEELLVDAHTTTLLRLQHALGKGDLTAEQLTEVGTALLNSNTNFEKVPEKKETPLDDIDLPEQKPFRLLTGSHPEALAGSSVPSSFKVRTLRNSWNPKGAKPTDIRDISFGDDNRIAYLEYRPLKLHIGRYNPKTGKFNDLIAHPLESLPQLPPRFLKDGTVLLLDSEGTLHRKIPTARSYRDESIVLPQEFQKAYTDAKGNRNYRSTHFAWAPHGVSTLDSMGHLSIFSIDESSGRKHSQSEKTGILDGVHVWNDRNQIITASPISGIKIYQLDNTTGSLEPIGELETQFAKDVDSLEVIPGPQGIFATKEEGKIRVYRQEPERKIVKEIQKIEKETPFVTGAPVWNASGQLAFLETKKDHNSALSVYDFSSSAGDFKKTLPHTITGTAQDLAWGPNGLLSVRNGSSTELIYYHPITQSLQPVTKLEGVQRLFWGEKGLGLQNFLGEKKEGAFSRPNEIRMFEYEIGQLPSTPK